MSTLNILDMADECETTSTINANTALNPSAAVFIPRVTDQGSAKEQPTSPGASEQAFAHFTNRFASEERPMSNTGTSYGRVSPSQGQELVYYPPMEAAVDMRVLHPHVQWVSGYPPQQWWY